MNDHHVRFEVLKRLKLRYPNAIVLNEYRMRTENYNLSRADIAIFNKGYATGIEIKSEKDNLVKLEKQIRDYGDRFDFCILIVGKNHLSEAMKILPQHWGVEICLDYGGQIEFIRVREARLIKSNLTYDENPGIATYHQFNKYKDYLRKKMLAPNRANFMEFLFRYDYELRNKFKRFYYNKHEGKYYREFERTDYFKWVHVESLKQYENGSWNLSAFRNYDIKLDFLEPWLELI